MEALGDWVKQGQNSQVRAEMLRVAKVTQCHVLYTSLMCLHIPKICMYASDCSSLSCLSQTVDVMMALIRILDADKFTSVFLVIHVLILFACWFNLKAVTLCVITLLVVGSITASAIQRACNAIVWVLRSGLRQ